MRGYCFIEVKSLDDLRTAGFILLTPENAQRHAIQVDGEKERYPDREALLYWIADGPPQIWQILPCTERDWITLLKERGITVYADTTKLEAAKPTLAADCLYVAKDVTGKGVGERRLPCTCGEDPIEAAKVVVVEKPIEEKPTEEPIGGIVIKDKTAKK